MLKNIAQKTRPKRLFYAKNINMNYSFDSLAEIALKQLGAELEVGDIVICDNKNRDKRKAMQWTKDGFMIYYGRLHHKMKFEPLADHNGQLKNLTQTKVF